MLVLDDGDTKQSRLAGAQCTRHARHTTGCGDRASLRRSHLAVDHVKVLVGKVCEDGIDVLLLRKRRNRFTIGARKTKACQCLKRSASSLPQYPIPYLSNLLYPFIYGVFPLLPPILFLVLQSYRALRNVPRPPTAVRSQDRSGEVHGA